MPKKQLLIIGFSTLIALVLITAVSEFFLTEVTTTRQPDPISIQPGTKTYFTSTQDMSLLTPVERELAKKLPRAHHAVLPQSTAMADFNKDGIQDVVGFLTFYDKKPEDIYRLELTVWFGSTNGEYIIQHVNYSDFQIFLNDDEPPSSCKVAVIEDNIIQVNCDRSTATYMDTHMVAYVQFDPVTRKFSRAHEYDRKLWATPDSSNWNTHTDSTIGISFKASADWKVETHSPSWLDFSETDNAHAVIIRKNDMTLTVMGIPEKFPISGWSSLPPSEFYETIFNVLGDTFVRQDGIQSDLAYSYPNNIFIATYETARFNSRNTRGSVNDVLEHQQLDKNGIRYTIFVTAPKTLDDEARQKLLHESDDIISTLTFISPNGELSKPVDVEKRMSTWEKISIPEYNFSFYAPAGYTATTTPPSMRDILWGATYTKQDTPETDFYLNPKIGVTVFPYQDRSLAKYSDLKFDATNRTCVLGSQSNNPVAMAPTKFAHVEVCESSFGDAGSYSQWYNVLDPNEQYIIVISVGGMVYTSSGNLRMISNTMWWDE
jgi:hypothetical protein